MTKLQRPERYVPLSVRFHTGRTGTELHKRFGRDGLLVWVCYLAACKVHQPPGQITYASEAEAWALLGLNHDPPDFTLEDFFAVTGRLKKTRRRRSGRVSDVICTVWERWSEASRTQIERERKARKRAEKMWDTDRTSSGTDSGQDADTYPDLEVEVELNQEQNPPSLPTVASYAALANGQGGRASDEETGEEPEPAFEIPDPLKEIPF